MSPRLLIVVSILYLWAAGGYYRNARYGMALAFVAYALANIGLAIEGE